MAEPHARQQDLSNTLSLQNCRNRNVPGGIIASRILSAQSHKTAFSTGLDFRSSAGSVVVPVQPFADPQYSGIIELPSDNLKTHGHAIDLQVRDVKRRHTEISPQTVENGITG